MLKQVRVGKGTKLVQFMSIDYSVQGYADDREKGLSTHVVGWDETHDRWLNIPISSLNSSNKLADTMASLGVAIQEPKYLMSYIHECLENRPNRWTMIKKMGWQSSTHDMFCLPGCNVQLMPDSHTTGLAGLDFLQLVDDGCAAVVNSHGNTQGEYQDWLDAVSIYDNNDLLPFQVMILAGFASPLLELCGVPNGSILSVISPQSGSGKSTALAVMDSIWGRPTVPSILGPRDTQNGRWGKMAIYNNIPMSFDEHTTMNDLEAADFIFGVSDGRDKNVMDQNRSLVQARSWKGITVTTANMSLKDKLQSNMVSSTDALLQRVCDLLTHYKCKDPTVQRQFNDLFNYVQRKTYGMVGVRWASEMVLNKQQLNLRYQQEEQFFGNINPDARFTTRLFAAVMTAAEQLTQEKMDSFFDVATIREYLVNELAGQTMQNMARMEMERFIPSDLVDYFSTHIAYRSSRDNKKLSVNDIQPRLQRSEFLWNDKGTGRYYAHKDLLSRYVKENRMGVSVSGLIARWGRSGEIVPDPKNYSNFMHTTRACDYDGGEADWRSCTVKTIVFDV